MLDPQKARHLLSLFRRYRRYLDELASRSDEELRADFAVMGGLQHYLLLAIETLLDLGSHVISFEGYEPPQTYADVFRVLRIQRTRLGELDGFVEVLESRFAEDLRE